LREGARECAHRKQWSRGESNPLEIAPHEPESRRDAQQNAHGSGPRALLESWERLTEEQQKCLLLMARQLADLNPTGTGARPVVSQHPGYL